MYVRGTMTFLGRYRMLYLFTFVGRSDRTIELFTVLHSSVCHLWPILQDAPPHHDHFLVPVKLSL
jgi:hypothetical protein